jgi:hypothetical protein
VRKTTLQPGFRFHLKIYIFCANHHNHHHRHYSVNISALSTPMPEVDYPCQAGRKMVMPGIKPFLKLFCNIFVRYSESSLSCWMTWRHHPHINDQWRM